MKQIPVWKKVQGGFRGGLPLIHPSPRLSITNFADPARFPIDVLFTANGREWTGMNFSKSAFSFKNHLHSRLFAVFKESLA